MSSRQAAFGAVVIAFLAACALSSATRFDDRAERSRICSLESIAKVLGQRMPAPYEHYIEEALIRGQWRSPPRPGRWSRRKFPLRVWVQDFPSRGSQAGEDQLRQMIDSVLDQWSDLVEPGVPSFVFKQTTAAEIRFRWVKNLPEHVGGQLRYRTGSAGAQFRAEAIDLPLQAVSEPAEHQEQLQRTIVHELGHALGLAGHSNDPNDVMYYALTGRDPILSPRDRNTLLMLYACPMETMWDSQPE